MNRKTGCIIGNSHAATLIPHTRRADSPLRRDYDFRYYAAPGQHIHKIQIEGRRLVCPDPVAAERLVRTGGSATQSIDEMDFFIIIGCSVSIFQAVYAMTEVKRRMTAEGPGRFAAVADRWRRLNCRLRGQAYQPPLLRAAAAVLDEKAKGALGVDLIDRLRKVTDAPILIAPQPRPSEQLLASDSARTFPAFRGLRRRGLGADVSALFESHFETRFAGLPDVHYIPQRAETIRQHLFTDAAYFSHRRGGGRNGDTLERGDVTHANKAYGKFVEADVLAKLDRVFGAGP